MAKRNFAHLCISIFVIIYVHQENVMVEGANISYSTALKTVKTELPSVRQQQVQFRRASCNCSGSACECIVRVNLVQINFNQLASIKIYYNPADVSLNLDVLLNGRVIYHTGLSARNPPPFCIPVPQLPVVMLCVRLYDIRLGNNSIRACINFEVQLVNNPILVVSFDCIRVGANGVGIEKPSPSALVDSPDPVTSTDDSNVLAYIGSIRPDNGATFSDSNIVNNTFPTALSLSDEIDNFNEQTTEALIPITTIASIDIATWLTTKKPKQPVSLAAAHQNTTYKSNLSSETNTEETISLFTTPQTHTYNTMPSDLPNSVSSDVSETGPFNYVPTLMNSTHTTERPSEIQSSLHLEQNDNLQSVLPITESYITATENITHSEAVSSDFDIINKIKILTTSNDRLITTSPLKNRKETALSAD